MIALIDNDVILKLAKWDLLNELVEIFGGKIGNIYHLPTCKWALCSSKTPGKALKRCGDQETIDRILNFCNASKAIPEPKESKWLEILNKIQGVDIGEVLIFSFGVETINSLLYIGDKRSIIALSQSDYSYKEEVVLLLESRIKCLEQVLAEMICRYGFTPIRSKVMSCQSSDMAIKIAFGSIQSETRLTEVWNGLYSYYSDLNHQSGGLLAPYPEVPKTISNARHTVAVASQTS